MGKIESTLRDEITRLARKEIRASVGSLSKEVTKLKRKVSRLDRALAGSE